VEPDTQRPTTPHCGILSRYISPKPCISRLLPQIEVWDEQVLQTCYPNDPNTSNQSWIAELAQVLRSSFQPKCYPRYTLSPPKREMVSLLSITPHPHSAVRGVECMATPSAFLPKPINEANDVDPCKHPKQLMSHNTNISLFQSGRINSAAVLISCIWLRDQDHNDSQPQ
jgi:hypothetical protein